MSAQTLAPFVGPAITEETTEGTAGDVEQSTTATGTGTYLLQGLVALVAAVGGFAAGCGSGFVLMAYVG